MAREYSRRERIADYLQQELALLIQRELRDPRIGMVSITAVEVSRDIAHARVYVTVLDCESAQDAAPTIEVLQGAAGFLRSSLARTASMRTVPRLRFQFDASVGRGRDLEALIDRATAADGESQTVDDDGAVDPAPTDDSGQR